MDLYRALYAFYRNLLQRDCEHARVTLGQRASYCPDCGERVKLVWAMVKCRSCGSRRVPRKQPDGRVEPLEKYCRHCGATEHQLVKKDKIDAYELIYCLSIKEIDYSEERPPGVRFVPPQPQRTGFVSNAGRFADNRFDIVEGEVIRKRYVSQGTTSAWQDAPFYFQGRNDSTPPRESFFRRIV